MGCSAHLGICDQWYNYCVPTTPRRCGLPQNEGCDADVEGCVVMVRLATYTICNCFKATWLPGKNGEIWFDCMRDLENRHLFICSSFVCLPLLSFSVQSIMEYNGAAILAMAGKDCVGICSDSRLGNQAQTVATEFEKIFKMGDKLMVRRDLRHLSCFTVHGPFF